MTETTFSADSFPLPNGTELPEGRIDGVTFTAYRVVTPDGDTIFRPFSAVHYFPPAVPLVRFV